MAEKKEGQSLDECMHQQSHEGLAEGNHLLCDRARIHAKVCLAPQLTFFPPVITTDNISGAERVLELMPRFSIWVTGKLVHDQKYAHTYIQINTFITHIHYI